MNNNFSVVAVPALASSCPINVFSFLFSGGEIQVKCNLPEILPKYIKIFAKLYNSDDIMKLFLITDALRHKYHYPPIHVEIPYLPYARQDRVCAPGEAFSLSVIANLINAQKYRSVTVWDPHSKETSTWIDNLKIREASEFVKEIPKVYDYLVCPDKGAISRVVNCCYNLSPKTYFIACSKVRDSETGELSKVKVDTSFGHMGNVNLLIVDDICDGGRTFINLAKELKKYSTGKIYLYVTHGIFSQGIRPLINAGIDHIYCPHIWPKVGDVFSDPWSYTYLNNLTEIKS